MTTKAYIGIVLQPSPFFPKLYLIFQFLIIKNGTNKKSVGNLSKDELIDEVLSLENFKNDINVKFSELNNRFNNFEAKYEMVNSNPWITRRCNDLLELRTQLECNNSNSAQSNLSKSTQCHLILLMKSWNNLCAKHYL